MDPEFRKVLHQNRSLNSKLNKNRRFACAQTAILRRLTATKLQSFQIRRAWQDIEFLFSLVGARTQRLDRAARIKALILVDQAEHDETTKSARGILE